MGNQFYTNTDIDAAQPMLNRLDSRLCLKSPYGFMQAFSVDWMLILLVATASSKQFNSR